MSYAYFMVITSLKFEVLIIIHLLMHCNAVLSETRLRKHFVWWKISLQHTINKTLRSKIEHEMKLLWLLDDGSAFSELNLKKKKYNEGEKVVSYPHVFQQIKLILIE